MYKSSIWKGFNDRTAGIGCDALLMKDTAMHISLLASWLCSTWSFCNACLLTSLCLAKPLWFLPWFAQRWWKT